MKFIFFSNSKLKMEDKTFLILSQIKQLPDSEKAKIIGNIALMMNGSFEDAYHRLFNSWRTLPNPNPKSKFQRPYNPEEIKEISRSRILRKKQKASRKTKGKRREEKLNRKEMPWQKLNKPLTVMKNSKAKPEERKKQEIEKQEKEKAKLDAELDAYTAQRKTFNSTQQQIKEITSSNRYGELYKIIYNEFTNRITIVDLEFNTELIFSLNSINATLQEILVDHCAFNIKTINTIIKEIDYK